MNEFVSGEARALVVRSCFGIEDAVEGIGGMKGTDHA